MHRDLINLKDYPLDVKDSDVYRDLVATHRRKLVDTGLTILPGFLTSTGVELFNAQIDQRMHQAYFSEHGPSSYFSDYPGELQHDILDSISYCMGRDKLLNTAMDTLYQWSPVRSLVADVTGNPEVFLHEDPSNALIVQMYKPGCKIGWHFDRALFACIINLSEPAAGGVFECAPNLRSEEDPGYDEVQKVLEGTSDRVQRHQVPAGSLSIMLGRYTFHRVSEIAGLRPRTSLVLTYETRPGVRISDADRATIFGPDAPRAATA